jgi:hypothetical protein
VGRAWRLELVRVRASASLLGSIGWLAGKLQEISSTDS